MKISRAIKELTQLLEREGDLELTCTGSHLPDDQKPLSDSFESTAETFHVTSSNGFGKHVRILWQC